MKNSLNLGNVPDAIRTCLGGSFVEASNSDAGDYAPESIHAPSNPSPYDPAYGGIERVCAITGKSRATVFRWVAAGLIPPPFKLGGRTQNIWDVRKLVASLENNAARGG